MQNLARPSDISKVCDKLIEHLIKKKWLTIGDIQYLETQDKFTNFTLNNGMPLLYYLCLNNYSAQVKYFISIGANINVEFYGVSCLAVACRHKYIKLAHILINNNARLDIAKKHLNFLMLNEVKHSNVVNESFLDELIKNGADINTTYCNNDGNYKTFLHFAAQMHFTELVKYLIKKGAKINHQHSSTPLIEACKTTCYSLAGITFSTARVLLHSGADIKKMTQKMKNLALYYEVTHFECSIDLVSALLDKGANPNTSFNKKRLISALIESKFEDRKTIDLLQLILQYGAHPDGAAPIVIKNHTNGLAQANKLKNKSILNLLLKYGASANTYQLNSYNAFNDDDSKIHYELKNAKQAFLYSTNITIKTIYLNLMCELYTKTSLNNDIIFMLYINKHLSAALPTVLKKLICYQIALLHINDFEYLLDHDTSTGLVHKNFF